MTEDKNITHNLREAIHREELSRPPMPKDLNAQLMQRVDKEVNSKPKRKHIIWPWIAAACVAAVIAVNIAPPKSSITPEEGISRGLVANNPRSQESNGSDVKEKSPQIAETEHKTQRKQRKQTIEVKSKETLFAKAEASGEAGCRVEEVPAELKATMQEAQLAATEKPQTEIKTRVLSERDIPITRPENLKYTKEELALMKRQANEAYLKWVELELEIAKYNQEQTALK